MLVISENLLNEAKCSRYKVYSREQLSDGVECFPSYKSFRNDEKFYITSVNVRHIKCENSKFYYTNEDLSSVADWFPAHVIPIDNIFVKCGKKKHKLGTVVSSDKCVVDVSGMPAFSGVNEDATLFEYRFFITLFNDYTVKQIMCDRYNLYDLKLKSSKYDLVAKLQNANLLKPNDFVVINNRRKTDESVLIGIIIKDNDSLTDKSVTEYGNVYINMSNIISIKWN